MTTKTMKSRGLLLIPFLILSLALGGVSVHALSDKTEECVDRVTGQVSQKINKTKSQAQKDSLPLFEELNIADVEDEIISYCQGISGRNEDGLSAYDKWGLLYVENFAEGAISIKANLMLFSHHYNGDGFEQLRKVSKTSLDDSRQATETSLRSDSTQSLWTNRSAFNADLLVGVLNGYRDYYVSKFDQVKPVKNNSSPSPIPATTPSAKPFFPDTTNDWYEESVTILAKKGIVGGYSDGTFRSSNTINRAELLKIVVMAKYGSVDDREAVDCFADVKSSQWYAKYVCLGKKRGIVEGYPDGTFRPGQEVTIAEGIKMTLAAFGKTFQGNPWYQPYMDYFDANVRNLAIQPWICGSGCVPAVETLTRGKMAEIVRYIIP